ncbi:RhtX/FptX family siderophore transporter [Pseudohoeflea suaedae]|uniref:RhtX/FptX family siderophore transporter n=1 Tax=Pseudohoeflea suaedae TaxID=877384 RepID=A0A4R5PN21_9HYPH|nr:MFS transporter [Pseudohoeflea suaedae]TDH38440.1 RhtX/FptX family siderophore transporter [Pseudohoeflea suaedae]
MAGRHDLSLPSGGDREGDRSATGIAVDPAEPVQGQPVSLYLTLAGLYLAQGIPTYLIAAALPPTLRAAGVSRSTIGLFSLLMLPLVLKFLWAPLVDRWRPLPRLGHRRGWIVPTQLLTASGIAVMAFVEPTDIAALFIVCMTIALAMSTQDIATDGYATRHLTPAHRAVGNAIQGGSVAFGVIVGGTFSLVLFERFGWQPTLLFIAVLSLLPVLVTPLMKEPSPDELTRRSRPSLKAFFMRPEARSILAIALIFRVSEGLVKAMEGPYLVDIGLPLSWIGYLSGLSAATAGLIGSVVAVGLIKGQGNVRALVTLGALRTICFALFAAHAWGFAEPDGIVIGAAAFQTFIRYMEIVVLYSIYMSVASTEQPGTDFTILACAQLLVYLIGSSVSGLLADRLGYGALFGLATALSALAVPLVFQLARSRTRAPQ